MMNIAGSSRASASLDPDEKDAICLTDSVGMLDSDERADITLSDGSGAGAETDPTDEEILEKLEVGPYSTAGLAAILGLPIADIRARVRRLTDMGIIGDRSAVLRLTV